MTPRLALPVADQIEEGVLVEDFGSVLLGRSGLAEAWVGAGDEVVGFARDASGGHPALASDEFLGLVAAHGLELARDNDCLARERPLPLGFYRARVKPHPLRAKPTCRTMGNPIRIVAIRYCFRGC